MYVCRTSTLSFPRRFQRGRRVFIVPNKCLTNRGETKERRRRRREGGEVVSRDRGSYIGCKVESREKEEERMRGEDIYIYKTDRSLLGSRHAEVHAEIERERERERYETESRPFSIRYVRFRFRVFRGTKGTKVPFSSSPPPPPRSLISADA